MSVTDSNADGNTRSQRGGLQPPERLVIVGASVRAAAFSALRAGLRPWCADLFADADLRARCPAVVMGARGYRSLIRVVAPAPPGPWMYTGALENHPRVVQEMARSRRLWGNSAKILRFVRAPHKLGGVLMVAGLPNLAVFRQPTQIPRGVPCLVKPVASSAGRGIEFWNRAEGNRQRTRAYYQQYVDGEPCAAVYVADGHRAHLLGVTRQLVGATWLHASPFRYCGSIGSLCLEPALRQRFGQLGLVLVQGCGLRGLFGVDCILRDGVPWPVEVNPRYTASVEVLEYATGLKSLALHRGVFAASGGCQPPVVTRKQGVDTPRSLWEVPGGFVGKAILFARDTVTIHGDGPWSVVLNQPGSIHDLPLFADIPHDGQKIEAGHPILTFFARGSSLDTCEATLREIAADLDRWLFGP